MKRFLSAAAAAALALSLNTAALAAGRLCGSITINGTALDTSGLPAASAPYTAVPLRSVAESDYGYAACTRGGPLLLLAGREQHLCGLRHRGH